MFSRAQCYGIISSATDKGPFDRDRQDPFNGDRQGPFISDHRDLFVGDFLTE